MNAMSTFTSGSFGSIRIVDNDGRVEFCARDVAQALGYTNANAALARHCKGVAKRYPLQTAGGMQELRFIGEGDLYRLIAHSKLPTAQRFESWVFDEVLPSIRARGGYMAARDGESAADVLARALLIATDQLDAAHGRIATLAPKAELAEAMRPSEALFTVTEATRQIANVRPGVRRAEVFDLLKSRRMICSSSTKPTRRGIDTGRVRAVASEWRDSEGNLRMSQRGKLTTLGIEWVIAELDAEGRAE
ncbi:hypothetical protein HLV35_06090 [Eggerthellaceae bacterium zg-997]|nr:hypothetical protein [Eggerthellaceae bacterium zg-997]